MMMITAKKRETTFRYRLLHLSSVATHYFISFLFFIKKKTFPTGENKRRESKREEASVAHGSEHRDTRTNFFLSLSLSNYTYWPIPSVHTSFPIFYYFHFFSVQVDKLSLYIFFFEMMGAHRLARWRHARLLLLSFFFIRPYLYYFHSSCGGVRQR